MANNHPKPTHPNSKPVTRMRGGVNRTTGQNIGATEPRTHETIRLAAEQRSRDVFATASRFAAEQFPGHPGMWVQSAYLAERYRLKREPSVAEVTERLRAVGRLEAA